MLLIRSNTYHLHRRVPKRYQDIESREWISISLHTDSEKDAKAKATVVWAELLDGWEAKLEGATSEGEARLAAAKNLAARRGRTYRPVEEVAKLPIQELLERIEAVVNSRGQIDMVDAEALLGGVPIPKTSVSDALDLYWKIEKAKFIGKSPDQIRRAKNPRIKAIRNFVEVVEDKPYLEVTTADLFDFRSWWVDRIEAEGITPNSANKDLVYVTSTLRAVATSKGEEVKFSTRKLALDEGERVTRPPFSRTWIKDKILAPGALDGLNEEAAGILLAMVNTGCRPSELAALRPAHIHLAAPVPHISIQAEGRQLKTPNAKRIIPLLGVSLDAMKRFPRGFPRYAENSATLSGTVNKYLRENMLLETPEHTLYSLRHAFEDRMLAAGVDERVRRDLMGHALGRERYGAGASLEHLREVLAPFVI